MQWKRHRQPRGLDNAEAIADSIARYARSSVPPDLEALCGLRKLTYDDLLAELAGHDLERRRRAAYQLAWGWSATGETCQPGLLDDAVVRLLTDPDPLLRSHGVAAVRRPELAHLRSRLRELQKTETGSWVQFNLSLRLSERQPPLEEDPWADQGCSDNPPF